MKKLITYISLFLFLIVSVSFAQEQVQAPDDKIYKEQYKLNGAWLPNLDPSEVGPSNFSVLKNMRYGDGHPVSVSGFERINDTALTTYTSIVSGHQLRSERTQKTYVLVNAENSGGTAAKVYQNQTAIPDQGAFEATELHTAATGAGLGRFSSAPQGGAAYCNEKESYIWQGEEARVAALFTLSESLGAELITTQANRDFSGASDWTNVDVNSYDETDNLTLAADASGQYCTLATDKAPMSAGTLYRITFDSAGDKVLNLRCDGVDESTTFTDSSDSGHTATANGDAQIDTAYKKSGTGSGLFDGTGDYLSIPDSADFNYGADEVTIETWFRLEEAAGTMVVYNQFEDSTTFAKVWIDNDRIFVYIKSADTVIANFSKSYTFVAETQYHFALIRGWAGGANTWAVTINGTIVGTTETIAGTWPDVAGSLLIGIMAWDKETNPGTLPAGNGYGSAFNNDGSLLAVAHDTSPYVTIYNTSDWSKVTNPSTLPTGDGRGVSFSNDGSLLAVSHDTSPYVTIYNTSDWSKVTNPSTLPTGNGMRAAFNSDDSLLAIAHYTSPYVTIYNTSDWSKVDNPGTLPASSGRGVSFNDDDSLLAVAHISSPYITIYNTSDWSKVDNPGTLPAGNGYGTAFNNDGSLLAVAHNTSPYVTIYNTSDWSKVTNPSTLPTGTAMGAAFNSDDSLLAIAHFTSPYVTIYNTSDWSKETNPGTLPAKVGYGAHFNNYDSLMAVAHTTSPYITIYVTGRESEGHKDEYRISKDAALWTANFDPDVPVAPGIDWTVKDVGNNDTITTITTGASHSINYIPSVEGGFRIESNASDSESTFDNFSLKEVSYSDPINYTEQANNTLDTSGNIIPIGTQKIWKVFTTRPAQGIKYAVKTANTTASTTICAVWTGEAFETVSNLVDGTSSGGISLAQDGSFTFDSTVATAKPYHFEGYYLYCYLFVLSDGSADISSVSVDMPWQPIVDDWDSVPRQPIQFQVESAGNLENYTNEVNYQSDTDIPIGGVLDGLLSTDNVVVMFDNRMAGIRFEMLAGLTNTNASVATIKYNTGAAWVTVGTSLTDGTDNSGDTMGKTGLISWNPPSVSAEHPVTLFGVTGYAYQITFSATLSGTKGVPLGEDPEVLVDVVTGIPAQKTVKAFKFPSSYKDRLLLCSNTEGNEGNRVDFSMTNAPDVFNGYDSSMDGLQSIYIGNTDPLTCGTQIYNRYGNSVHTIWLALKATSTYVLTGDTPDPDDPNPFRVFPVSFTIGCPAPLTLVTAEVGYEAVQGVQRNIAFWLSHSGPVMFDGSVLFPIPGIDKYFDPSDSECINFEYIENARGWYDSTNKEVNFAFPSGAQYTYNNKWVVYDIIRKKWYEKDTTYPPISAIQVADTEGNKYVYGGTSTGRINRLEYGDNWDGSAMTFTLTTGDFCPTKSVWDRTLLRRIKIITTENDNDPLDVYYYKDTASGGTLIFDDLSLDTASLRLAKITRPLNLAAWSHRLSFVMSSSYKEKALEILGYAIQYNVIRDDL